MIKRKNSKIMQYVMFAVLMFAFSLLGTDSIKAATTLQAQGGTKDWINPAQNSRTITEGDFIGRYSLNYTGNVNYSTYWITGANQGEPGGYSQEYVYNDLNFPAYINLSSYKRGETQYYTPDNNGTSLISSFHSTQIKPNSSTAALTPSVDGAQIKYAYLIWYTRDSGNLFDYYNDPVCLYFPDGTNKWYAPEHACIDTRYGTDSYLCLSADVTDDVRNAGYGTYGVANIPYWYQTNGTEAGQTAGATAGGWQLVIVEESADNPVRAIKIDIGSTYAESKTGYTGTLSLINGLTTKPVEASGGQVFFTGVTGNSQFKNGNTYYINNTISSDTKTDIQAGQNIYSGRFRNSGSDVNSHKENQLLFAMLEAFDDIGNNSTTITTKSKGYDDSWNGYFCLGMAVDLAFPAFDGQQKTIVNGDNSVVTVTGGYTNTTTYDTNTGIGGGALTVTLDDELTPKTSSLILTKNGNSTSISGTWDAAAHTVTFDNVELLNKGDKCEYVIACDITSTDDERFTNKDELSGYLYSNGARITGIPIEKVSSSESYLYLIVEILLDPQGTAVDGGTIKSAGTSCYYEYYQVGNYADKLHETPITKIEIPTKDGCQFMGYYTGKNGTGTQYVEADGTITSTSTTFTEDTTLYAHWIPGIYKITLDNRGANDAGTLCYYEKYTVGNFADEDCTISITDITLPKKSSYEFKGYWTGIGGDAGGGTICVTEDGKICTLNTQFIEDTTIYADWESGYFVITCDNQGATTAGTEKFYEQYAVQFLYDKVVLLDGTTDITYNYNGGVQTFAAPYTGTYTFKVYGAQGGSASHNGLAVRGGYGGYSYGSIELNQGDILYIYVGGMGGTSQSAVAGAGGFNGGGYGARNWGANFVYGGGGGATDIRVGGTALANRVIVAGGGGAGAVYGTATALGGAGGGLSYQPVYAIVYGTSSSKVNTDAPVETALLGSGRNGSGGGYYGGRFYSKGVYITGGEGGTGYVGGVTGGASAANLHSGNGLAVVTRSNYTTELTPTTKIDVPTKTNYYFRGYYTEKNGAGTMVADSKGNIVAEPDCFTGDSTVYAYWSDTAETNYIIRFHGNGESDGSMEDMKCTYGKTYRLSPNGYAKEGYHFLKWNTNEDGTGTEYADEQSISNLSAVDGDIVNLYAQWEANSYTIVFHPNDGAEVTHMDDIIVKYGDTITLPDVRLSDDTDAYVKYTLDGVNITEEVLSQEVVLAMDGTVVYEGEPLPEGSRVDVDGTITYLDGTIVTPSGIITLPEGIVKYPDGSVVANLQTEASEEEPQPDKKAYASVFMGWSLEDRKADFEPQWKIEEIDVSAIIDAADMTNQDDAIITLYAVWDDCPWITATHLYYTLEQAQSGFITEDEILSHMTAYDREDGSPIEAGFHEDGTSFSIPDYAPTDFTQFQHDGSCTENLTVVDSTGSVYAKQITVYVADTTPVAVKAEGTTRFINEYYYNQPYEWGGLEDNSVWKTDPEYIAEIQTAFDNLRNDTPQEVYHFTHEQILEMKEFVSEHGIGNSKEPDALSRFYDEFMVPNRVK